MTTQENNSASIKVTVRDFLMRYLRYWPLFAVSLALVLFLSFLYLRYATPQYSVRATMQIKTENGRAGASGAQEFESMFMMGERNNINSEIEILKSLTLAERTAASLGLQKKYFVKGNIKTTQNYPISPVEIDILKHTDTTSAITVNIYIHNNKEFSLNSAEGAKHRFGEPINIGASIVRIVALDSNLASLAYKEHMLQWVPLKSAAFELQGRLTVGVLKDQSNILALNYLTPHKELGVDILNQLMVEYTKLNIEKKNETTSRTISFINDRLELITRELGNVEGDLQVYKQRNRITNLEAQSENFITGQSQLEREIADLEVRQNVMGFLQDYIQNEKNQHEIVPPTLGIEEDVLVQQIAEYNVLQLKRSDLLENATESHPTIKNLESQAALLRSNMLETLRNLRSSSNIQLNKLNRKNDTYQLEISSVPLKEKELLEITRQQGIKQQLYLYLLEKREETAISQAATVSSSNVVDPAIASGGAVSPNPLNVRVLAVFLGLLLPLGFVYFRELLDDKLGSRLDITKVTGLPIFGEIGHSKGTGPLLVQKNARDVVTEQFRMIRSNLKYLVNDAQVPTLLITSTFSGEGKSFISINTGAVMALAGKRTVVLELDIRKPKISSGLNLSRAMGLSNYLVNSDISPAQLPVPVKEVENLFVVPCGPIPPNPSEMLLNKRLDELFQYLKENFDVVVIDTAPVGLVSDALTLSRFADCTLYVVRMGYTAKKQIHFVDELYTNQKLPNMGLLINDISESSHYYSYGNYGGYGYGYGYGKKKGMGGYYSDTEEKAGLFARIMRVFSKK